MSLKNHCDLFCVLVEFGCKNWMKGGLRERKCKKKHVLCMTVFFVVREETY